jgi:hypothetical protein
MAESTPPVSKQQSWKDAGTADMQKRDAALESSQSKPKAFSFAGFRKASSGMTSGIRHLVSKKKKRFQKDGFDLDLAYITPQIIAMGIPATGKDAIFRNPAPRVKEFLVRYHPGACKVYNLCIEPNRQYQASLIGLPDHLLEVYGHYDHNPPPLFCVAPLCRSISSWLSESSGNVAAIHCKAGKGRTGTVACMQLLWSGAYTSAEEAMTFYGKQRTHNGKGVTIPSQARYVGYTLEVLRLMRELGDPSSPTLELPQLQIPPLLRIESVRLQNAPDAFLAPNVSFAIEMVQRQGSAVASGPGTIPKWRSWRVYDHKKNKVSGAGGRGSVAAPPGPYEGMVCEATNRPVVAGDVKVTVKGGNGKTICAAWFHTAFVSGGALSLAKIELDKAKKNKSLPADFGMVVSFSRVQGGGDDEQSARAQLTAQAQAAPMMSVADDDDDDDDEDEK